MLEADPNEVEKMKQMKIDAAMKLKRNMKFEILETYEENVDYNPPNEDVLEVKFKVNKSSASHDICDIKQITFGANSSRFWILRKHINSMDKEYQNA